MRIPRPTEFDCRKTPLAPVQGLRRGWPTLKGVWSRHTVTTVDNQAVKNFQPVTKAVTTRHLPVTFSRQPSAFTLSPSQRGFTMIEIAIAIGVIGFALVAVMGILPRGMNVQKDNREDTIISQDAPYFLNAIRNGEQRTNNSILMSNVEEITVTSTSSTETNYAYYTNTTLSGGAPNPLLYCDSNIVGLLSTPEFDYRINAGVTNVVTAIVRAMSGSAVGQTGPNAQMAFRYQMTVENMPWNFNFFAPGGSPYYTANNSPDYMNYISSSLHELRLRFAWPVLPNGNVGPNRQTFRTSISGHLSTNAYPYCYFQPSTYLNTNL
jgi:prepilin-type N-terminal cleavage/methylation domain-containing protein